MELMACCHTHVKPVPIGLPSVRVFAFAPLFQVQLTACHCLVQAVRGFRAVCRATASCEAVARPSFFSICFIRVVNKVSDVQFHL